MRPEKADINARNVTASHTNEWAIPSGTDRVEIDVALVQELIATQFPHWAKLPIQPVPFGGWDNRTFHLGEHMLVRLPSAAAYSFQVQKEQYWLPRLAKFLPLPIPTPLAMGTPADHYPWHWSIYQWLDGETAANAFITSLSKFAVSLAQFITALQGIDPTGGPPSGPQNFHRGGPLAVYNGETRQAITALDGKIDTDAAHAVWEEALAATWHGPPAWLHGDISAGNLLVEGGQLSAVIDFGSSGVGDPACDLAIAWTFFHSASRQAFRMALPPDNGIWARGRGWALWKALIVVAELPGTNPLEAANSWRVLDEIFVDHRHAAK